MDPKEVLANDVEARFRAADGGCRRCAHRSSSRSAASRGRPRPPARRRWRPRRCAGQRLEQGTPRRKPGANRRRDALERDPAGQSTHGTLLLSDRRLLAQRRTKGRCRPFPARLRGRDPEAFIRPRNLKSSRLSANRRKDRQRNNARTCAHRIAATAASRSLRPHHRRQNRASHRPSGGSMPPEAGPPRQVAARNPLPSRAEIAYPGCGRVPGRGRAGRTQEHRPDDGAGR